MANVIDSYSETNQNNNFSIGGGFANSYVGQTFTGNGATLGSAVFYLHTGGASTGNLLAYVYNLTGTFGTNAVPSGSAIAISDAVDFSTLSTSYQLVTFNFSGANQVSLTNAANYGVAVSNTSVSFVLTVGDDVTNFGAAGNYFVSPDGSSWTGNNNRDFCFYVYDNVGSPLPTSPALINLLGVG